MQVKLILLMFYKQANEVDARFNKVESAPGSILILDFPQRQ